MAESELCTALPAVGAEFADEQNVHCRRSQALLEDLVIYELGSDGDNYQFLVAHHPAGWIILRAFELISEGRGNMSGWLDGVRATEQRGPAGRQVTVDYRVSTTNWDTGSLKFEDNTSCVRILCGGATNLETCARQFELRSHGGLYEVSKGQPNANNWPYEVGAPIEQYDCRVPDFR